MYRFRTRSARYITPGSPRYVFNNHGKCVRTNSSLSSSVHSTHSQSGCCCLHVELHRSNFAGSSVEEQLWCISFGIACRSREIGLVAAATHLGHLDDNRTALVLMGGRSEYIMPFHLSTMSPWLPWFSGEWDVRETGRERAVIYVAGMSQVIEDDSKQSGV